MFISKQKYNSLVTRVNDLENSLQDALRNYMERIGDLSRRVNDQHDNHLLHGVPVWDGDGPTGERTNLDVREVVRALAEDINRDIVVRKSDTPRVMLNER